MKKIPEDHYGDLMTLEEFVGCCECGGFINYDGFGVFATEDEMSDIQVVPTDITVEKIHENGKFSKFTHVVWYNR